MELHDAVLREICRCCSPRQVILYGEKVTAGEHSLKSADFCIVLDEFDRAKLLKQLYLTLQFDIPVQFLLYSTEEWNDLIEDHNSYAYSILKKGTVLYEQKT